MSEHITKIAARQPGWRGTSRFWYSGGALVGVMIAAAAAWQWRPRAMVGPSESDDPISLAKFCATSEFDRLDETYKRQYSKVLRQHESEIADAFRAGQLTSQQYDQAYLCGWMERQLDHMRNFFAQPEAKRDQYLREERAKKTAKSNKPRSLPPPSDGAEQRFVKNWIKDWPPEQRAEWDVFREAQRKVKSQASAKPLSPR